MAPTPPLEKSLSRYTSDIILQAANLELQEKFRSSLYHTSKYLCGYKDMTWNTHGPMITALEAPTTRKLIVMPRGTFKSSIGVVGYSVYSIIRNPNVRILIDSEVYTNSKNFIREIRGVFTSKLFMQVFGDWRSNNWTEGEITVGTRTRVLKEASVTAGGINTVKVGQHYDIIIFDDLNSNNNSNTKEGCQSVIEHYKMAMAILDPGGTAAIIGTRYSAADVIQYVLDTFLDGKAKTNVEA